ncbi:hypothetical protein [Candidatus Rhabdochlamydia sp. T3358]|uniref:hypothetical protein n=1 Tax=Candidatus Rhabdochlamydia sp. T3358 TaxID=2099795 RepID=UPI0010BBC275|nr:hypothetical protein [Candidatus Rhabdochlamydia sp. T3358]VHO05363.1 hypothetical protein RHT_01731 [Candidatus Rhabdochlamydia sp. T3358]
MAFPIENGRNLAGVNWARNPRQQEQINFTKNVTDYALTKVQETVTPKVEQAVANKCPQVPRQTVQAVVGFTATQVKDKTQNVANKVIESNWCYGSEDSCISRTVNRRFK